MDKYKGFIAPIDLTPKEPKRIPRKIKKKLKRQFPMQYVDESLGVFLWYAQSYNHKKYHWFRILTLCEVDDINDFFEVGSEFWNMLTNNGRKNVPQYLTSRLIKNSKIIECDNKHGQVFKVSKTKFKIKYKC